LFSFSKCRTVLLGSSLSPWLGRRHRVLLLEYGGIVLRLCIRCGCVTVKPSGTINDQNSLGNVLCLRESPDCGSSQEPLSWSPNCNTIRVRPAQIPPLTADAGRDRKIGRRLRPAQLGVSFIQIGREASQQVTCVVREQRHINRGFAVCTCPRFEARLQTPGRKLLCGGVDESARFVSR